MFWFLAQGCERTSGSLRRQLLRTLTGVLLAVFATQGVVLYMALGHQSHQQTLMHLSHDGDSVLAAVVIDAAGRPALDERFVESVYRLPGSGQYFLLQVHGGGQLASSSLGTATLDLRLPEPGNADDYEAPGPDGQPLQVLARTSTVGSRVVTVLVAEDKSAAREEIWRTGLLSLAVFVPLLVGALLLQSLVVSRALRPLRQVREELADVGAGRHARIEGPVSREIQPLVDEVNRLLVLLEHRVRQSRTAIGNLAHALKTPLAVLFQTSEAPDLPTVHRATVRAQASAMHERVERELRRARLAGTTAASAAQFNPATELAVLLRMMDSVHRDKALQFDLQAPDTRLPFDREDMLELCGNLVDNACKWARTRCAVQVRQLAPAAFGGVPAVQLVVADDGPGCPPEEWAELTTRGRRLDESKPGHGLGLGIVRDVVDFLDGRLEIGRSEALGGLVVTVTLPMPGSGGSTRSSDESP
jgi:signal transduction histidine kinase